MCVGIYTEECMVYIKFPFFSACQPHLIFVATFSYNISFQEKYVYTTEQHGEADCMNAFIESVHG